MKRLLPLLVLIFSINALAQDYACIIPTDTPYFINADGYLRGIRIDSVRTIGSDTVYYPFRTERHFIYSGTPLPDYDTSNGSWMARKVVKQSNGIFRFHTYWLDTIFIDTKAMPGDSWTFYDDIAVRQYVATVTSIDTMTIKGVIDSVKKIQLSTYIAGSVSSTDSLHGFEILLSKNHGFASVFDLYMFPYVSPTGALYHDIFRDQIGKTIPANYFFKQVEFHVPTFLELYDFTPGDVYITANGNWSGSISSRTVIYDSVITKTTSSSNTKYTTQHKSITTTISDVPPHYTYSYVEDIDTFIYADNSSAFAFSSMPEEAPASETVWRYKPNDTSNCSAGTYYSRKFIITFEGCENYFSFKRGFPQLTYKEKTGSSIWPEDCPSSWEELLFSKKGSVECGRREAVEPVTTKNVFATTNRCTVYPNPANETLNLKGIQEPADIIITDITGRQIISTHTSAKETSIDIYQLAPGPYIIRVNDIRQTFIKQ